MNLTAELSVEEVSKITGDIYIPARPAVLERVTKEVRKPGYDTRKVADIISSDVAITAGVIKTVNSPFFGIPREVVSIHQGVMMLGLKNIINLVTALSLRDAISYDDKIFMERFWKESTDIALISSMVAKKLSRIPAEESYLLGLLHNCGAPLLMQRFPEYADVYKSTEQQTDLALINVETEHFKVNHAMVGYMVGIRWNIPAYLSTAISRHHDVNNYYALPDAANDPSTQSLAVFKIAEQIFTKLRNLPEACEWTLLGEAILDYLNIDEQILEALTAECRELL